VVPKFVVEWPEGVKDANEMLISDGGIAVEMLKYHS
jgi:hypothetical protein